MLTAQYAREVTHESRDHMIKEKSLEFIAKLNVEIETTMRIKRLVPIYTVSLNSCPTPIFDTVCAHYKDLGFETIKTWDIDDGTEYVISWKEKYDV